MKLPLSIILFFTATCCSYAQTKYVYIDNDFNPVGDSSKATSKLWIRKYTDDTVLWAVSRYTLDNRLTAEGVYNDRSLNVANGPFKLYNNANGLHFLMTTGYYFNGVKFGRWIYYFPDGHKMKVQSYRGDQFDGPYELFNDRDTIPYLKGNYFKGKKNGEWVTQAGTDIYKDGAKVETIPNKQYEKRLANERRLGDSLLKSRRLVDATQPASFNGYMRQKLSSYFMSKGPMAAVSSIEIEFIVDENGKLTDGRVVTRVDSELQEKITRAIDEAMPWSPATENGKPRKQVVHYTFIQNKTFDSKKLGH